MRSMFYIKCLLSATLAICGLIAAMNHVPYWGLFLFLSLVAIPDGAVYK